MPLTLLVNLTDSLAFATPALSWRCAMN